MMASKWIPGKELFERAKAIRNKQEDHYADDRIKDNINGVRKTMKDEIGH